MQSKNYTISALQNDTESLLFASPTAILSAKTQQTGLIAHNANMYCHPSNIRQIHACSFTPKKKSKICPSNTNKKQSEKNKREDSKTPAMSIQPLKRMLKTRLSMSFPFQ